MQMIRPAGRKRSSSPDIPPPYPTPPGRLFACPFQKAYPDHSSLDPLCSKGWHNFHRTKEHVKAKHSSLKLDPCLRSNVNAEALLSRRSKRMLDVEKWNKLFEVQFGRSPPSPFVEQDKVDDALDAFVEFSCDSARITRIAHTISDVSAGKNDRRMEDLFQSFLKELVQDFRCERSQVGSEVGSDNSSESDRCTKRPRVIDMEESVGIGNSQEANDEPLAFHFFGELQRPEDDDLWPFDLGSPPDCESSMMCFQSSRLASPSPGGHG